MGLDMYVLKTKSDDFSYDDAEGVFYWRKHPNLHGWMEQLYNSNGGMKGFNGIPVRLGYEEILKLERDILFDNLPKTDGFFFGESHDHYITEDLKFVALAKELLNDGWNLFYNSSW